MRFTDVVSELEMELVESQNQRDQRVEDLWRRLDPQNKGELDFKGLKRGLRRIDHPLKNADDMLRQIIRAADTSGDGKIQYEEFRKFVETAERQLLSLFRSIDHDRNGRLDRAELQAACKQAGLSVSIRRLWGFFDEIDMNQDGFISFDEWRDFLLFMPPNHGGGALEAALSYYSTIITVNAEGDSMVSDDTLDGLGTTKSFPQTLFAPLLKAVNPESHHPHHPSIVIQLWPDPALLAEKAELFRTVALNMLNDIACFHYAYQQIERKRCLAGNAIQGRMAHFEGGGRQQHLDSHQTPGMNLEASGTVNSKLTGLLPEPGYFVAGAVSGGVSRTATAPLDRLKVYLLVNTESTTAVAVKAVKQGRPLTALRDACKPIAEAIIGLYRTGGLRTFFAGNGLNVVKIMPESAIRFGSYEASKRLLAGYEGHENTATISTVSKFVAGGMGGMTAQFCVYPIDTLKFRLQCETVQGGLKGNALLARTAKHMWADGGFRAAYRGLGLGLIGMFPYSAIDIGTFEFLKKSFGKYKAQYYGIHEDDAQPGNMATALLGASSGALGATVVYPLNVLRTRLQTQGTAMHPATYTGIFDVARKTIRNEGVRGLYKGLTPNLLKVAPALSITWVCYENSKKLLELQ